MLCHEHCFDYTQLFFQNKTFWEGRQVVAAQARMNVYEMMGRNLKTFNLKFKATLSLGFKLLLHTLQVAKWILVTVIAELYIIRKMQSSFFPKENLYPYFIHPLHSVQISAIKLSAIWLPRQKLKNIIYLGSALAIFCRSI